jgi:HK97 family phage major capsid protein
MSEFSIASLLRAAMASTWSSHRSEERDTVDDLHERYGAAVHGGFRLPADCMRAMTVSKASAGGFLASTQTGSYIDDLRAVAAPLLLGATTETLTGGDSMIVVGKGGATTKWLTDEADEATESTSAAFFGAIATTRKTVSVLFEVGRRVLQQTNAEALIRRKMRAAAADAVSRAVLAGTGTSGQPLGIVETPGLGVVAGAGLALEKIIEAQTKVGETNAIVDHSALGWAAPPAVAGLLAQRQKFAGTDEGSSTTLWEDDANDGTISSRRALSTTACPAATAIYGDWSAVTIYGYPGGVEIALDPATKFKQRTVAVRAFLDIDVVVTRPAFSIISGIS